MAATVQLFDKHQVVIGYFFVAAVYVDLIDVGDSMVWMVTLEFESVADKRAAQRETGWNEPLPGQMLSTWSERLCAAELGGALLDRCLTFDVGGGREGSYPTIGGREFVAYQVCPAQR